MKKMKKTDAKIARIFANTLRFIVDLAVLRFGVEFEKSFKRIYFPKLKFKEENHTTTEGSFLDLRIKIRFFISL